MFEKAIGSQAFPCCSAWITQFSSEATSLVWPTVPRVRIRNGFCGGIVSATGCPNAPSPVSPRPEVYPQA